MAEKSFKVRNENRVLTPKQLAFVEEYLRNGGNAEEAYKKSYDVTTTKRSTISAAAWQLIHHPAILKRIEIAQDNAQRNIQAKANITVESLMIELDEARRVAVDNKQASAAVQATMGKAKLAGLLVEQVKDVTPQPVTDDEMRQRLAELAQSDPSIAAMITSTVSQQDGASAKDAPVTH